mmetsp:Transcript_27158/g.92454  ORF Transcript_27158/g.92454 Transcript_27158/m.92454 type:complete len:95 (-) Transcript_27158:56-340(-)
MDTGALAYSLMFIGRAMGARVERRGSTCPIILAAFECLVAAEIVGVGDTDVPRVSGAAMRRRRRRAGGPRRRRGRRRVRCCVGGASRRDEGLDF